MDNFMDNQNNENNESNSNSAFQPASFSTQPQEAAQPAPAPSPFQPQPSAGNAFQPQPQAQAFVPKGAARPSGKNPPFTPQEIASFKHKAEGPIYATMVIINILIVVVAVVCSILAFFDIGPLTGQSGEFINKYVLGIEAEASANAEILVILIFLPIVLIAAVYFYYAQYRANAIRITEKNFPEIYEVVQEYAYRLGMKKVPNVYLAQENGVLNAFSTFILRRQYVVLLADLFEVAYLEHHDLESIKFIIGHEMSHIRLRHATFSYQISIMFANYIPILSTALSRAREYSCDRVAQHLVGVSGVEPMLALIVGKHLYKKVDVEDYVKHCHEVRGFFVFIYNLMASHPIMPKRIRALIQWNGSGELY